MICPTCQRTFDDGVKFCTFDGARLLAGDEDTMMGDAENTMAGEVTMMGDATMVGDELAIPTPGDIRIRVRDQSKTREIRPGDHIGVYRVLEQIGQGGMATVYLAEHPFSGKRVAIKLLNPRLPKESAAVERFMQEARTINQLGNRNIIDIIGFDKLPDGRHYIVLEYLSGETLQQHLARSTGPLPIPRALKILKSVANALDAAHAQNIVHRDLKPENIFLERPDSADHLLVKLLDFGAAKLVATEDEDEEAIVQTKTGIILGTPDYMSPEQCDGEAIDPRSDIYSLGMVAFQLLTGRLAFTGDSFFEVMSKRLNQKPPLPSSLAPQLGLFFDGPLLRALDRDPAARFPTAGELATALETAALQLARQVAAAVKAARSEPTPVAPGEETRTPASAPAPAVPAASVARPRTPGSVVPPSPASSPGHPPPVAQDWRLMVAAMLVVVLLGLAVLLLLR